MVSDGSAYLHFWDASTLNQTRRVRVVDPANGFQPVNDLNELEWVHGWVFANVWQTNRIVVIDPASGVVVSSLDGSPLSSMVHNSGRDVLNGIAYSAWEGAPGEDGAAVSTMPWGGRMWLTGKKWDALFEVTLTDFNDTDTWLSAVADAAVSRPRRRRQRSE